MTVSDSRMGFASEPAHHRTRLIGPALAIGLALFAGVATASGLPDTTIRYASFATMVAALVCGVVAARRGSSGIRAVNAIVAVIALMLGSTFFGLTYS